MRLAASLACVFGLSFALALSEAQTVNMNRPEDVPTSKAARSPKPRVPPAQLQAHAKELADLAGSVPADVDRVNQGLLPKDTGEKLKRIEELSKRLKNELGY
jgi:hypothetical protein